LFLVSFFIVLWVFFAHVSVHIRDLMIVSGVFFWLVCVKSVFLVHFWEPFTPLWCGWGLLQAPRVFLRRAFRVSAGFSP